MSKPEITVEQVDSDKLRLHVDSSKGKVIVDFGRSITHLEIPPHEAEIFGALLMKHAAKAKFGDL